MNYEEILRSRGVSVKTTADLSVFIVCPFHDDHDASCSVFKDKGNFHCFGCGETGKFFELMAAIDGVPVRVARREFYEEANVEEVLSNLEHHLLLQDEAVFSVTSFDQDEFHRRFPSVSVHPEALEYAKRRGLSSILIERFDLRWGTRRGSMRNRIIVPVYDEKSRLVAWCGRAIHGEIPKVKKKERTSNVLFGLHELLMIWDRSFLPFNPLIIVEGDFDAEYLQELGYAAVATLGTAGLSPRQLALVLKCAKSVVLCYDNDTGGRKAVEGYVKKDGTIKRGDREKLEELIPTYCLTLPEGKDPNDLPPYQIHRYFGQYRPRARKRRRV